LLPGMSGGSSLCPTLPPHLLCCCFGSSTADVAKSGRVRHCCCQCGRGCGADTAKSGRVRHFCCQCSRGCGADACDHSGPASWAHGPRPMRLGGASARAAIKREFTFPIEAIEALAEHDNSHHDSEELFLINTDYAPQTPQETQPLPRRPGTPPITGARFPGSRFADSYIAEHRRPAEATSSPSRTDQLTQLRLGSDMESAELETRIADSAAQEKAVVF
jgi:hypothetical protein